MPRYIDADRIDKNQVTVYDYKEQRWVHIWEIPTVEAVPVVRCKDYKWYEIEQLKRDGTDDKRYKPSVCVIGAYAEPRKADWYCADGERREDAEKTN